MESAHDDGGGGAACPLWLTGVWKQDKSRSESLAPFLAGLMPAYLSRIAGPLADNLSVTLRIACLSPDQLEIVDKTALGRNATRVTLDGSEHERATRNGRKRFMLSGEMTEAGQTSVIRCRLFQRGEGWETRMERSLSSVDPRVLVEKNILERPGHEPVVVRRYFNKTDEDVQAQVEVGDGAGS